MKVSMGLVAIVFWAIISCDIGGGNVDLSTNRGSYALDSSTVIQLEVFNGSDASVYYICTGQIQLEEYLSNERQGEWMVHGFEECYSANPIKTDKQETFEIDLGMLYENGFLAGAAFDETVVYRLKMDLFEDDGFEDFIPADQRTSHNFQIIRN